MSNFSSGSISWLDAPRDRCSSKTVFRNSAAVDVLACWSKDCARRRHKPDNTFCSRLSSSVPSQFFIESSIIRCNLPDNLTVLRKCLEKRGVKQRTQKKPGVCLCYLFSRSFLRTLSLRCECQYIRKVKSCTRRGYLCFRHALLDLIGLMLTGNRSLSAYSTRSPIPLRFEAFVSPCDSLQHPVLLTSVA